MGIAVSHSSVTVGVGWKWLAVLIALGALVVLFAIVAFSVRRGSGALRKWIQGPDSVASTSKFQWLLWLIVVLFAYITLWILRAKQGDYSAVPDVPRNVLVVLGISTTTMAAAKGIETAAVNFGPTGAAPPAAGLGGIFEDDTGFPDIGKIQIVGFTAVAVSIFVATVIHQIVSSPPITSLPDIDGTLMVLMGLSSGGYLAKKAVTDLSAPPPVPPHA